MKDFDTVLSYGISFFDKCMTSADCVEAVVETYEATLYIRFSSETLEVLGQTTLEGVFEGEIGYVEEMKRCSDLIYLVICSRSNDGIDDSYSYFIEAYNATTGKEVKSEIDDCEVLAPGALESIAVSSDSSSVLVPCKDGKLRSFDASGALMWEREFACGEDWFAFSLSNGSLLLQDSDKQCFLVDGRTGNNLTDTQFGMDYPIQNAREIEGKLYVYADDANISHVGGIGIIDETAESFGCESWIPTARVVSQDASAALASFRGDGSAWAVPIWSLDDEIAYAKELIIGQELTASERGQYHID